MTGNKFSRHPPIAIETTLGWIISGPIPIHPASRIDTLLAVNDSAISDSLTRFWEIEEIPNSRVISPDDQKTEYLFAAQDTRDNLVRYNVPLLFKEYPPNLGNSYTSAIRCDHSLKKRLLALHEGYIKFMREYLEPGHMCITSHDNPTQGYLSHHGVLRTTNIGTKLRVVSNGSKKTSNNISLNEQLLTGLPLQTDLPAIIIRSRRHKIIFTADMRHMFRQILILEEHRIYQKILRSFDLADTPDTYYLLTV